MNIRCCFTIDIVTKVDANLEKSVLNAACKIIYFIKGYNIELYIAFVITVINMCFGKERLLQMWNILDHTGISMSHICVSNAWHEGIYTILRCYQNIAIIYSSLKRHRWSFLIIFIALRGQKTTYKHRKKQFVKYTFEILNVL